MERVSETGKMAVLMDGQFGSTGKGLIAGYLGMLEPFDIAVSNAAPNAGHTCWINGKKLLTYHLPMAGVVNKNVEIFLCAGAIIDPNVLMEEIARLGVNPKKVHIHPRAAVITGADVAHEQQESSGAAQIASTQHGVGSALAAKIRREGVIARDWPTLKPFVDNFNLSKHLQLGASVIMEIPQGYGLGINSGLNYPHCTSREISVSQALADAGVHPSYLGNVIMSLRTYPIRVGHLYATDGKKIGDSGPFYPDSKEITWADLGVTPEITTVTGRVRRVASYSLAQQQAAFQANRPSHVFLNFVNYLQNADELRTRFFQLTAGNAHIKQVLFGTGPAISDVSENLEQAIHKMGWASASIV